MDIWNWLGPTLAAIGGSCVVIMLYYKSKADSKNAAFTERVSDTLISLDRNVTILQKEIHYLTESQPDILKRLRHNEEEIIKLQVRISEP